jgi:hypothetical protein
MGGPEQATAVVVAGPEQVEPTQGETEENGDQELPVATVVAELPPMPKMGGQWQANGWFSPGELKQLEMYSAPSAAEQQQQQQQQQNMGSAPVQQHMGGAPNMGSGGPGAAAMIAPAGAMPMMMNATSAARVTHGAVGGMESGTGVESRDPMLNSREELIKFFSQYGVSRPKMVLSINCRHREVRTRTVQRDGKYIRREELVWITDVRQNIEISDCIFPWGRISTDAGGPVEEVLNKYLLDTSSLKSLSLDKKVLGLDQEGLCQLVRAHYKNNGYQGECNVTIEFANTLVRVAAPGEMAACIDSCCCQFLMCITIIPGLIYCAYAGNHQYEGLQAVFQVPPVYTPQTIFGNIVNQLHHPGNRRAQGYTDLHRAKMDRRYFEQRTGGIQEYGSRR